MQIFQNILKNTSIIFVSIAIIIGLTITIAYLSYPVALILNNIATRSTDYGFGIACLFAVVLGVGIILAGGFAIQLILGTSR